MTKCCIVWLHFKVCSQRLEGENVVRRIATGNLAIGIQSAAVHVSVHRAAGLIARQGNRHEAQRLHWDNMRCWRMARKYIHAAFDNYNTREAFRIDFPGSTCVF